jgi:transmembrane sensor
MVETVSQQAQEAASAWLARFKMGGVEAGDQVRFERWLAADASHRRAYDEAAHTWERLGILEHLHEPRPALSLRRLHWKWSVAAGLSVAIGAALFVLIPRQQTTLPSGAHRTAVGVHERVVLSDRSTVDLDTDTLLKVAITPQQRSVTLEQGAALFDVAPDAKRPFVVTTPSGVVRALGTAFLVRVEDDRTRVIVTQGAVQLEEDHAGLRARLAALMGAKPSGRHFAKVEAGQQSIIGAVTSPVESVAAAEVQRRLAWKEGMLRFDRQPLSEVVAEVERYTDVRFVIEDENLKSLRVGVTFPANDIPAFVRLLEYGLPLQAQWRSAHVVRLKRKID